MLSEMGICSRLSARRLARSVREHICVISVLCAASFELGKFHAVAHQHQILTCVANGYGLGWFSDWLGHQVLFQPQSYRIVVER